MRKILMAVAMASSLVTHSVAEDRAVDSHEPQRIELQNSAFTECIKNIVGSNAVIKIRSAQDGNAPNGMLIALAKDGNRIDDLLIEGNGDIYAGTSIKEETGRNTRTRGYISRFGFMGNPDAIYTDFYGDDSDVTTGHMAGHIAEVSRNEKRMRATRECINLYGQRQPQP